ncbi:MAG TPA: hypothetical protein VJC08_00350 [bacterium]|nr:hypothetical protein [bacterium]
MKNEKTGKKTGFTLTQFDIALLLLLLVAVLSVYFTFFKPIVFSHLIEREGVIKYAEVEIVLPEDLSWIKEVVPPGNDAKDVYGRVGWTIISYEPVDLGGKKLTKVRLKASVTEDTSGVLRFGKYVLVKGNKIFFISDTVFLEGRVIDFQLLK